MDGLEIVKKETIGHCEDCILANMKCHPFDDEVTPEETPLQHTNIDVWEPSHVSSEGGALYAMKFHNSGTSHRHSFFLKDRLANTTLKALKTYKLESEKVTGKKMVYVCTNNAPEFKSNAWATFFNENGTIHVPTAPYSSTSNGTAECSIGISTAAVQVMLNDSHLPLKWWAEAWAFGDYVENLLLSVRHPGEIPEERWTRVRQDVGHLRVWGCVAYVYVPKEKGGGKLSNRGQRGSVRATLSNIPKQASCRLYKNSGSGEMRLMGDHDQIRSGTVRGWLVEIGASHQIWWNILREHNWGVPSAHIRFIYYVTYI